MISGRRERLRRLSSITVSQMSGGGELSVPLMDHQTVTHVAPHYINRTMYLYHKYTRALHRVRQKLYNPSQCGREERQGRVFCLSEGLMIYDIIFIQEVASHKANILVFCYKNKIYDTDF